MILKIYRERGKKTKRVGGRGLTLTRIILRHYKNFRGACLKKERNGKNRARSRSGATIVLP
jgi:hypothetical protein